MILCCLTFFVCVLVLVVPSSVAQDNAIVGGRNARPTEIPYQLSLRYAGRHVCGGALVQVDGIQVALTVAHCIQQERISSEILTSVVSVVGGDLKLNDSSGNEQVRYIQQAVLHQNFNYTTFENDVAVLFLNQPFVLNHHVNTITLPDAYQNSAGQLTVSGWGKTSSSTYVSNHVQVVKVPIVEDSVCQLAFSRLHRNASVLCAQSGSYYRGHCNGDSGGPAISESGFLAGLVAFVNEGHCGHPEFPQGFMEVSHFIGWMKSEVNLYV